MTREASVPKPDPVSVAEVPSGPSEGEIAVSSGAGQNPVPASTCPTTGETGSLDEIQTRAVHSPSSRGVKVAGTESDFPGLIVAGSFTLPSTKGPPLPPSNASRETLSFARPVLRIENDLVTAVSRFVLPKSSRGAGSEIAGFLLEDAASTAEAVGVCGSRPAQTTRVPSAVITGEPTTPSDAGKEVETQRPASNRAIASEPSCARTTVVPAASTAAGPSPGSPDAEGAPILRGAEADPSRDAAKSCFTGFPSRSARRQKKAVLPSAARIGQANWLPASAVSRHSETIQPSSSARAVITRSRCTNASAVPPGVRLGCCAGPCRGSETSSRSLQTSPSRRRTTTCGWPDTSSVSASRRPVRSRLSAGPDTRARSSSAGAQTSPCRSTIQIA